MFVRISQILIRYLQLFMILQNNKLCINSDIYIYIYIYIYISDN